MTHKHTIQLIHLRKWRCSYRQRCSWFASSRMVDLQICLSEEKKTTFPHKNVAFDYLILKDFIFVIFFFFFFLSWQGLYVSWRGTTLCWSPSVEGWPTSGATPSTKLKTPAWSTFPMIRSGLHTLMKQGTVAFSSRNRTVLLFALCCVL